VACQSGICCSIGNFGTKHHSDKLIGQPPKARYRRYMQAAGLAVQLHKTGWKEKLTVDSHCFISKVVAANKEVQTESWLDLLQKIFWFCLSGLALWCQESFLTTLSCWCVQTFWNKYIEFGNYTTTWVCKQLCHQWLQMACFGCISV